MGSLRACRYDNNAALTEVFHALSVTFPVGETFFIDSVMHYAPKLIKDHPELWQEVGTFCWRPLSFRRRWQP